MVQNDTAIEMYINRTELIRFSNSVKTFVFLILFMFRRPRCGKMGDLTKVIRSSAGSQTCLKAQSLKYTFLASSSSLKFREDIGLLKLTLMQCWYIQTRKEMEQRTHEA
jgi:hypothetical protein